MAIFISDKPFVRYDGANFIKGTYHTDDEDKIKRLEKSRFYGKAFYRVEDIIKPTDAVGTEFESLINDSIDTRNTDYENMSWPELRKYAFGKGVDIYKKGKEVILKELKEKLK